MAFPRKRLVWEAELAIDETDPFFFDHPLEHVPAMLMMESALALAGEAVAAAGHGQPHGFRQLALEFHRFCELNSQPTMRVWEAERPGHWRVELRQNDTLIAAGSVAPFAARGEEAADDTPLPGAVPPVPAVLVHRARQENVLIGALCRRGTDDYTAELLTPPPRHHLRRVGGRLRPLGELIEGVRQFVTLLGHEARDVAVDHRLVVTRIEITLERPVRRAERVLLRTRSLPEARRRGTGTMSFSLSGAGDAGDIGTAQVTGVAMSAEAYARLRASRRQSGEAAR
ncbi:hypothetical protein AQJ91_12210 [Streptomyces dysideae]|uniref:A-factor biosynthesis hotdog domain-containing protein n=1 Tax=Streptomyces dysideae TaxID=909626 RepID=A0A101V1C9_9ACTN|nr:hypothetical protein AQJ91_12210 [Streptomyces dysideae]